MQVLHGMKTDDPSVRDEDRRQDRQDAVEGRSSDAGRSRSRRMPTRHRSWSRRGRPSRSSVTGGDVVTGHDPATGKELWRANGLNPSNDPYYRIVASPLMAGGLIIAPTRNRPMLALRPGGRGDVTTSHKAWWFDLGPDVPSPVSDGKLRLRRPRQRRRARARCEDGGSRVGAGTAEDRRLQLVAGARRRQDLRHERERRADVRLHRGTEVRDPRGERARRLRPRVAGDLERA